MAKTTELKQYQDARPAKHDTKAQRAGRPPIWPEPMYMDNARGHKAVDEMSYPLRTSRQKCIVDVEDISGDRGKGAY